MANLGSWERMREGVPIVSVAPGVVIQAINGFYDECTGLQTPDASCTSYGNYV